MVCAPDGQTVTDHNQQIYRESKRGEWSEPEPLTEQTTAKPYPIDALPGIIGAACSGFISRISRISRYPVVLKFSDSRKHTPTHEPDFTKGG